MRRLIVYGCARRVLFDGRNAVVARFGGCITFARADDLMICGLEVEHELAVLRVFFFRTAYSRVRAS